MTHAAAASVFLEGLEPLDKIASDIETLNTLFILLGYIRPTLIVEAGTYRGHFSVGAARILPESNVWTADIKQQFEDPKLENFHFHEGDFEEMLEWIPKFDFGFIDSGPPWHGGEDPKPETGLRLSHWYAAWEKLEVGGLLVCHDTVRHDWLGGDEIVAGGTTLRVGRGITFWEKK